jgi:hypothetical protein
MILRLVSAIALSFVPNTLLKPTFGKELLACKINSYGGKVAGGNARSADAHSKNQSHYCGKAPETIGEYIFAQNACIRNQFWSFRQVRISSLPEAMEKKTWSIPT